MHPNAELITRFYDAFARLDAEAMAACYHPEVEFSDPVFTDLRGEHAGNMWRMLCARAEDLEITASAIEADDQRGSAHWDATYTFSATRRKVRNSIDASFRFEDGRIREHRDRFSLWRWTRMALGVPGVLLGWSPIVQNKVREQAAKNLTRFEADAKGPP